MCADALSSAVTDPDGLGRGELEFPSQMVSNDSMSQVRWVRQSRCLMPLAQMETGVFRGVLVLIVPLILCYLLEHREKIQLPGSSEQPLVGLLPRGSVSHWSSISSALQHSRGGMNPSFSLGGSLPHENCRASVGLSCSENLVLMVGSSSDMDQDDGHPSTS